LPKSYTGQRVAQITEKTIDTNFELAKGKDKKEAVPKIEQHRSTLDLKEVRQDLKRLQKPFRK
jgi:hypothetical protein